MPPRCACRDSWRHQPCRLDPHSTSSRLGAIRESPTKKVQLLSHAGAPLCWCHGVFRTPYGSKPLTMPPDTAFCHSHVALVRQVCAHRTRATPYTLFSRGYTAPYQAHGVQPLVGDRSISGEVPLSPRAATPQAAALDALRLQPAAHAWYPAIMDPRTAVRLVTPVSPGCRPFQARRLECRWIRRVRSRWALFLR